MFSVIHIFVDTCIPNVKSRDKQMLTEHDGSQNILPKRAFYY